MMLTICGFSIYQSANLGAINIQRVKGPLTIFFSELHCVPVLADHVPGTGHAVRSESTNAA